MKQILEWVKLNFPIIKMLLYKQKVLAGDIFIVCIIAQFADLSW